jgi:hypothetical protein
MLKQRDLALVQLELDNLPRFCFGRVSSLSTSRLNSRLASRGPCATRLHNRNAACPRLPPTPRSDPKGNSDVCASLLHKLGPENTRATFPRVFVCQRVPGSCHLFAIDRTLPSPTMFAFYSLDVKLLFVRSDYICGRIALPLFGPPG